jgi:hypothetical protein
VHARHGHHRTTISPRHGRGMFILGSQPVGDCRVTTR